MATLERALRTARHPRRASPGGCRLIRHYDPATKVLTLDRDLPEPTRAFQLATQLADLLFTGLCNDVLASAGLESATARDIARIGLLNYAAGALVMPYRRFAASAMELRHDIEQLQHRYNASFEQVSHRLSTLQRPGARGVPFYFVRVDQAGNITKRHSSTRFQFARFGGSVPAVERARGPSRHPGRILCRSRRCRTACATCAWGAAIVKRSGNFLRPNRQYAIGIGCEVAHADKVVYSEGLSLDGAAVPVGVQLPHRANDPIATSRAFPPLGRKLTVRTNERRIVPFSIE